MESRISLSIVVLLLASSHFSPISASNNQTILSNFVDCLMNNDGYAFSPSMHVLYFPTNSSYNSVLYSTVENKRFRNPAKTDLKPLAIVRATNYDDSQVTVKCAKQHGVPLRIRSGGHDYEGLSFRSRVPFVLLDLQYLSRLWFNFNSYPPPVTVQENTAWVNSGAMVGEVYYWINHESPKHGFSAATCPTVGVGGHFSGGGFGTLSRKYGLAADNIVDAHVINPNGEILDRESMGEDLFWAIRGGGGGSFGVVIDWKIKLLEVPPIVTVSRVSRTASQGATDLVHKWQTVGRNFTEDLFMRLLISPADGNNIQATFETLYLGRADQLLAILNQSFPELGLRKQDCTEMSWIQSTLFFGYRRNVSDVESLRLRLPQLPLVFSKSTSDYVTQPLAKPDLETVWKWCLEDPKSLLIFEPYGGRMDEIPESDIPFPHRKGILYNIQYMANWENATESDSHLGWIKRLYERMTPYVSNNPRRAYVNYKDLNFGVNNVDGETNFSEADRLWGSKYFAGNFRKLAMVKSKVDPQNFFNNEQSIPLLYN